MLCNNHGALTINDVYIRNSSNRRQCKFCSKESAIKRRLANPDKFKEHGKKYRNIIVPSDALSRICSKCKKDVNKEYFSNCAWKLRHPYCKSCMSIANYKSKIRNKNKSEEHKLKAAEVSRRSYLKKTWGMSLEQFNELNISQNGLCAICKINADILHIDHNHSTGKIRALLCNNCNRGIGHLKESTEILNAAIDYIRDHSNII